jgi:hypothetical protein
MRRFAILAMLALGVGCDDPEVAGKITDVLQYGIVQATATCYVSSYYTSNYNPSAPYAGYIGMRYTSQQLIDGSFLSSCILTPNGAGPFPSAVVTMPPYPQLSERGHGSVVRGTPFTPSQSGSTEGVSVCEASEGNLIFRHEGTIGVAFSSPIVNPTFFELDMSTYCTGRNLEAFGVE